MEKGEEFLCWYCTEQSDSFDTIIEHLIKIHEKETIKVKISSVSGNVRTSWTKNYGIIPKDIRSQERIILPQSSSRSLKISRTRKEMVSPIQPIQPVKKIRVSTPKKLQYCLHDPQQSSDQKLCEALENMSFDDCNDGEESTDHTETQTPLTDSGDQENLDINVLNKLLPRVLEVLKSEGHLDMYMKFNKLVADGVFPMRNVAFLLFKDVVEWFALQDTRAMRYSPEIKQFWKVGVKLFKGKFLRFMGGMKNKGQGYAAEKFDPVRSSVNFIVPDRRCIDETEILNSLKQMEPRIIPEMILLLGQNDVLQTQTYKLCVDGKKINNGLEGQKQGVVNLWGHEGPPTLEDRNRRLKEEIETVETLSNLISSIELRDIKDIQNTPDTLKAVIPTIMKTVIGLLSVRIRDLRCVKQKKEIALEKLKSACSTEGMKAKYSYALSSIKTYIFRISACIDSLLCLIDSLSGTVTVVQGSSQQFCVGHVCNLNEQENYICLTGLKRPQITKDEVKMIDPSYIKQRSETWKTVRTYAKVTGSTGHEALGLNGLKKLKQHYEYVFESKAKPDFSPEVQKRMQHGSENEVNAVATLVGKILPVFYPSLSYVEEGCNVVCKQDEPFLLVSPDGSIRHGTDQKCFGVEIKCPYPGNIYRGPVYYEIPFYYVFQILSEMSVLDTKSLLFLCYSLESTVLLEATFDELLWKFLADKIDEIYGSENRKCPKRLPCDNKETTSRLKKYCKDNVKFICEVKSLIANECEHDQEAEGVGDIPRRNLHKPSHNFPHVSTTISNVQTLVYSITSSLKESHQLSSHLASEVLVFLLADLDRLHLPERQHSVPVGYALKGYSLTTSVLRDMLKDVLSKCFHDGLYVPVISFDGQWYTIAVRSENKEPLTLLQLMKDVFKEAKSTRKVDLINYIKQVNIVNATTKEDVLKATKHQVNEKDGKLCGPVIFWRSSTCDNLLASSTSTLKIVKAGKNEKENITETDPEGLIGARQEFLNSLPDDVADLVEDDILENLNTDLNTIRRNTNNMLDDDVSSEMAMLFENNQDDVTNMEISAEHEEREVEPMDDNTPEPVTCSGLRLDYQLMLQNLQTEASAKRKKWGDISVLSFQNMLNSKDKMEKSFYREEILICLKWFANRFTDKKVSFSKSWRKTKLVDLLFQCVNNPGAVSIIKPTPKKRLLSLRKLCMNTVSKFPKQALNVIYAEHVYPMREREWRSSMFAPRTEIFGLNVDLTWYSKPEYVSENYMYLFSLLDCHHLLANARVKCCSSGMKEAGISKQAWIKVARESVNNGSGLSRALVEDIVDKQSNAYARKVFSLEVENAMNSYGYVKEAEFCRLFREWYSAEDDPGIDALERCRRRLNMRSWLLRNIKIGSFPPPGSHINGIPIVMFEGLMTNIERRIQLYEFVKKGTYNVRSLGSLEAENFFGCFQDLDPKGSGVIRPDDIPAAITTACELMQSRYDPERVFFMNTSRAKVYPAHELEFRSQSSKGNLYVNPLFIQSITPKNHVFDLEDRALRKKPKCKSGEISKISMPSKGVKPIREYHHCDESKILPHIRMGIDISTE